MPEFFEYLVIAMLVVVWSWLLIVAWFYSRLRNRHPATYEAIGSPSLFWNNSVRSFWMMLKFLFSSKPNELADATVSRLACVMRAYLLAYPFVLVGWIVAVFMAFGKR